MRNPFSNPKMTPERYCDACGEPTAMRIAMGGTETVVPCLCPCREEALEMEERMRQDRERGWQIDRRMAECFGRGYDRELSIASLDEQTPDNVRRVVSGFVDSFGDEATGYGLLLYGAPDRGKTFAAKVILSECIRKLPYLAYGYTTAERYIQEAMDFSDTRDLRRCDLLVLDDLGAERLTSFGQSTLFELVNWRYDNVLPTIITTNLGMDEFMRPANEMAHRLNSRILERCLPVEVSGTRTRVSANRYDEMKKSFNLS